jgi:hypothetical protein
VETGQRVVAGRYRLLAPLGAGGMGTVWRAEDLVLGRTVAVKEVTFPQGLSDEDRDVLRERTRREARAAARLDHPSAVTVYDVVEVDGTPYLVMELVEARTLSQVVRADGPLSAQRTAEIGLALLGALEAAHRQGIVHRDVKPGNVLLGDGSGTAGRVVLTDFGIASSAGDSSITSTGLLLGSPSYIAPERARGQAPAPASDLWSLGATLFTAVEGKPPFDAGEPLLTVTAVVTGEHEPFVNAGPLAEVLEGLLERDPARRLGVDAARRELEQVAAATDPAATTVLQVPDGLLSTPAKPAAERTAAMDARDVQAAANGAVSAPRTAPATPAHEGWTRPPRIVRRRRSRRPWAVAGLLLGVAAAVVALVIATDPARNGLGELGALVPGIDRTPDPEPSAEPEQPQTPEGWTRYVDEAEGWSIAVPPGYVQTTYRGTQVQFKDPDTRRTLRVDYDPDPGDSPLRDWQRFSPQLVGVLGQYNELRLEETEQNGLPAADLEFTYFDQTDLHVLDRRVHAQDGSEAWSLYWQVPEPGFAESLPVFKQIAASFSPND